MPTSQIQAAVDAIANQQVDNEMGTQRYALLFKPGTYGSAANPLNFQVGYYTEVAGLGASPTDVIINGSVDVYNRCLTAGNCIALNNFWRSLSNLTINVMSRASAATRGDFWASRRPRRCGGSTSTAVNLTLMDYCTPVRSTRAAASSPTRRRRLHRSTARSSSAWCGTAASTAGPTASGTRSSPASWARRPSRSPPSVRAAGRRTPRWRPAR